MDRIESGLIQAIERRGAPGATVAWVINDRPVNVRSAGKARLIPPLEMSTRTVLPWFSVTKLFTATAVLQLVEAGRLDRLRPTGRRGTRIQSGLVNLGPSSTPAH